MNRPLVVVDVQPAYCTGWTKLPSLMTHASSHEGPLLLLVNAETEGLTTDTILDCREFWFEAGLAEDTFDRARVVDKGYGYLRGWMDIGVDEDTIVSALRRMIDLDVLDSRDLPEGELEAAAGAGYDPRMDDEPVSLGWLDVRTLSLMRGCLLCGGGRTECLREVELLLRAHGIEHELLEQFVYDGAEVEPAPAMRFR